MNDYTETLLRPFGPTEARLLQSLARHGPQSRAQLASNLGVMRSTVGTQVLKLLDAGLLRENPPRRPDKTGAGRPGSALDFNPHYRSFIGVDLGVGHVRGVLIDLAGKVLGQISEDIPPTDQTPARMSRMVADMLVQLQENAPTLEGLMISVPGLVNKSGTIVRLPLLNWQDVQFSDLIARDMSDFGPIDINIDNDANIFARGELLVAKDHDTSVIYLWIDAGFGAGIVVNNALLAGANGQAGEIGHMFAHPPSARAHIRLEDIAGKPAILAHAQQAGLDIQTIIELVAQIDQGDTKAMNILDKWADVMSETFSSLASIFDPKSLVLSGPLAPFLERALPMIEPKTRDLLYHGTVMPSFILSPHHDLQLAHSCATIQRSTFLNGCFARKVSCK